MKKKKKRPLECIGCGCSDADACAGGCSWVRKDPPVCNRCYWIARRLVAWFVPPEAR